jgi:hypothetical protein
MSRLKRLVEKFLWEYPDASNPIVDKTLGSSLASYEMLPCDRRFFVAVAGTSAKVQSK